MSESDKHCDNRQMKLGCRIKNTERKQAYCFKESR